MAEAHADLSRASLHPRRAAGLAILVLVLGLMGAGMVMDLRAPTMTPSIGGGSDAMLYRRVISDVASGRNYYEAAPAEMRKGHFPLRPFVTVRPPLLAVALARLPGEAARRGGLALMTVAAIAAWSWRLRQVWRSRPARFAGLLLLLVSGVAPSLTSEAYLFHETWAALLIALSLALRRPDRFAASLIVGLVAALARELAIPFLMLMGLMAAVEGRRRETLAWIAATAAAFLALAAHALLVARVTTATDIASPGWTSFGGWPFVLKTLQWNALVVFSPAVLAALLGPLALLGFLGFRGGLARRTGATVFGYIGLFCVIGRPENFYWGLLIAPLWPLGLAGLDGAIRALLAGAPPPLLLPLWKRLEAGGARA